MSVTPNSPAAKAGFKQGDVILSFDGHDIEKLRDLPILVAETPADQTATIQVWRDNARSHNMSPMDAYLLSSVCGDLVINVTKTKKLTNMRASGSDEKMKIAPPLKHTLEEALEYIQADEYVEVTPKSIRLRKIFLNENERKRNSK